MTKNNASKQARLNSFRELGIVAAFFLILAVLVILSPNSFARPTNLINILKQASINGILATGMMFVIISGGIDLSVGSTVALAGVIAATYAHPGEYPLVVPIALSMLVGLAAGIANGLIVAFGNIPPFIVSLGSMTIIRGLALIASNGQPVFNVTKAFENIAGGFVLQYIPHLVIFFLSVTAISAFVLTRTVFGRRVYAVGGNEATAKVSGINVNMIKIGVYSISGFLAGLAGLLLASRIVSGNPTAGQSYELDAIAAAVIGGVSMTGGAGKWYGTVIGALIIAVIGNGLDILNVSSHFQLIIKGTIIIVAVLLDVKGKGNQ
ncbi:ABC transporter permease [Pelolinea submarina]|uniref:Ribose transport system permease protein/inositol transport system permease protein n=1 Tax=Pelolinea submarina TaxID=913107 RepID=A0A347ZPK4_9CHLR|nr:ABC transporter permease [Pelolinea submarina]REG04750.1 ribose transport system permease protein/inositol transport system permease protein [Pelolinea submarina]BBB47235.1 ribose transport system permease protein [Pelolinea submarina]